MLLRDKSSMDTKILIVSGVLAMLMVSAGFVLMIGETNSDEETEQIEEQQDSTPVENSPPQLFLSLIHI